MRPTSSYEWFIATTRRTRSVPREHGQAAVSRGGILLTTVLVELAWVLRVAATFSREAIAMALRRLCDTEGVTVEDESRVRRALALLERGPADFSDCLFEGLGFGALARSSGPRSVLLAGGAPGTAGAGAAGPEQPTSSESSPTSRVAPGQGTISPGRAGLPRPTDDHVRAMFYHRQQISAELTRASAKRMTLFGADVHLGAGMTSSPTATAVVDTMAPE